jgi:hypothetical protein
MEVLEIEAFNDETIKVALVCGRDRMFDFVPESISNGKHLERMDLVLLKCQPESCNVRRLVERDPRDHWRRIESHRGDLMVSSPRRWDSEADCGGTRIGRFGSVAVSITLFLFFLIFPNCDARLVRAGRLDRSKWIRRENNPGLGQGFSGIFCFCVERLTATPQFLGKYFVTGSE